MFKGICLYKYGAISLFINEKSSSSFCIWTWSELEFISLYVSQDWNRLNCRLHCWIHHNYPQQNLSMKFTRQWNECEYEYELSTIKTRIQSLVSSYITLSYPPNTSRTCVLHWFFWYLLCWKYMGNPVSCQSNKLIEL